MVESNTKSSFDRLVAGLNAEDRLAMLNRINQVSPQNYQLEFEAADSETTVTLRKSWRVNLYSISLFCGCALCLTKKA